jgi:hypothetical protein
MPDAFFSGAVRAVSREAREEVLPRRPFNGFNAFAGLLGGDLLFLFAPGFTSSTSFSSIASTLESLSSASDGAGDTAIPSRFLLAFLRRRRSAFSAASLANNASNSATSKGGSSPFDSRDFLSFHTSKISSLIFL